MKRRVLLLEPNYKNKYPPMGLMKLAMYHRLQKDDVVFYKGDLAAFVLSQIVDDALTKLSEVASDVDWRKHTPAIREFIQYGKIAPETPFDRASQRPLVMKWLEDFRRFHRAGESYRIGKNSPPAGYYESPRWDRVCVTTLFTFYWDITIETIEFAKKVCKDPTQVLVGGILASLVPDKVKKETGINPYIGAIREEKILDDLPIGKTIDELPLDYSILEEIDYKYPATDAYYAYATRGCIRTCKFCAVPILEPNYNEYISLKERLHETKKRFGEQKHLLLLDNNAFASRKFDTIIDEIRDSGFGAGATFVPPNQLAIAVQQLRVNWNDRAYIRMAVRLLNVFVEQLEGEQHDKFYRLLLENKLLHDYTATADGIITVYEEIKDVYENARPKRPVVRFIDFNQGMDARLATPKKMAKLATVAIRPLRIAFDSWAERQHYVNAIDLAQKNGIKQMSNYLLYNFEDKPVELYNRLLLNVDLCEELHVNIYSFPMKFHPIMDEKWFSNRNFLGKHWTRKAIRTIQAVLNSTAGKIGRGRFFFFKAFGRNEAEFEELIRMPEAFIIKRWDAELNGLTEKWRTAYNALSAEERMFVDEIVDENAFSKEEELETKCAEHSSLVRDVLKFHYIKREDIPPADEFAKIIKIEEFEKSCPQTISAECARLLGKF